MNKKEQSEVDTLKSKILCLIENLDECNKEKAILSDKEVKLILLAGKQKLAIRGLEVSVEEKQGALNFVNSIIYNDYPENFSGGKRVTEPTGTQKLLLNIRSILVGEFIL